MSIGHEGAEALFLGYDLDDNPHPEGSDASMEWAREWKAADGRYSILEPLRDLIETP